MNKLIFLGTGSANNLERQMTSLCFVIGKEAFLIDCGDGMGTMRQLVHASVPLPSVNTVFITHHHADHVSGMPHYLFLKLYMDEKSIVHVYGPRSALGIVRSISDQTHTLAQYEGKRLIYHSIRSGESVLFSSVTTVAGARVEASVAPGQACFGYRVTVENTSIAFTSDMSPNENFDRLAKRVDILIHECFSTSREEALAWSKGHSTAKDAGIAATRAGAKRLILTHLRPSSVIGDGRALVKETKQYFSGPVTLAQDLMEVAL